MEEILKTFLETRQAYLKARQALIDEMKQNKVKRVEVSEGEWITYYSAQVKENVAYHTKDETSE